MARYTPKIPMGFGRSGLFEFSITDAQWRRMEAAYGRILPSDVRAEICNATRRFLLFVESEQTAEPIAGARDRVLSIKGAASKFQKSMLEKQKIGPDSRLYADRLISQYFHDPLIANRSAITQLVNLMTSVVVACNHALAHLDERSNLGRRSGETWQNWIRQLTDLLRRRKLPIAARKDVDKNIALKPSPFVVLVTE